ncbi:MAG: hypothetical protein P9L92_06490 [Candidatus Electryonea clarkiae]|nr:hypothetical protein [Candidatus Electryonea clarkiae]MDP8287486.1 hypothetical protein [Candidatus Electryonea clarkiae]
MRRIVVISIVLLQFLINSAFAGKTQVRYGETFDPRAHLRVVVMPAEFSIKIKKINPRTVSDLFTTELLDHYNVLDLDRFEQYLKDNKLDLQQAFTAKGRAVVKDSVNIDAIFEVEIYRWDEGTSGFPFGEKGSLGLRMRLTEPFSGQIIWSANHIAKVKPGSDFIEAATMVISEMVNDLNDDISLESTRLLREEVEATEKLLGEKKRKASEGAIALRTARLEEERIQREKAIADSIKRAENEEWLRKQLEESGEETDSLGTKQDSLEVKTDEAEEAPKKKKKKRKKKKKESPPKDEVIDTEKGVEKTENEKAAPISLSPAEEKTAKDTVETGKEKKPDTEKVKPKAIEPVKKQKVESEKAVDKAPESVKERTDESPDAEIKDGEITEEKAAPPKKKKKKRRKGKKKKPEPKEQADPDK